MTTFLALFTTLLLSVNSQAATADNGTYDLDLAHSSISFNVTHAGIGIVSGRFNSFKGNFVFNANGSSNVTVTVDTVSIDTNNSQRDNHLRGDDFFETQSFPKMKFSSTQVAYDQNGDPIKIIGNLTLHGVTKPVTLLVSTGGFGKIRGVAHAGFSATTSIKRTDFAMNDFLAAASDDIEITLHVEGIKR